ncbi:MAG: C25 family cysteine peptidase [Bacteroidales bacterium]|nr:C25 family cysteine peptidase [Bacteroidales bacterium]
MKKLSLFLLTMVLSLSIVAGNWTGISSQTPAPAEVTVLSAGGSTTVLNFHVQGFDLKSVETPRGTAYVLSTGNTTPLLIKGAPDLSKISTSIIVPDLAHMGVRVISSTYTDYSNIALAPSKGNFTRDIDPSQVPYTYGTEYDSDRFFPEQLAELSAPYIMRDFRGQTVQIRPFQYNALSKTLRVFHDVTVEVYQIDNLGANPLVRTKSKPEVSTEFENIYKRQFVNFGAMDYTPVADHGKMLIIAHGAFMNAMLPLVEWKNSIGIPTEMVDVATIGVNAPAIKTYIANYYNQNTLTFVLLVGDNPQIPTNTYTGLGGPSDVAFGYIVGNDRYPDAFIGRFSAETVAHVETQVTRTLEYEKNPQFITDDWYTTCTGIASSEGPGDDNEYDYQHIRNLQADLMAYNYTSNPELFDGNQGGNDASGNPTTAMVATEVNGGNGIMCYTGHGSTTAWSSSGFSNSNVNALTNMGKLPFVLSVACVNGEFMNTTCFAEAWLRATSNGQPTGAIAFLGATINQSWNPPMEGQDEMIDIIVETYPTNIKRTFGGLSMNGCAKMNDTYGSAGMDMTDTWTIFGDPSLMVRTAKPTTLSVNHNPTIFAGTSSFVVNCTTEGARVTLSKNGSILGTGNINSGSVTISFPALTTPNDTVKVTVVNYNKIPYIGLVPVIPASGPYVMYNNSTVADNGANCNNNGQLDFGELSGLSIGIKNIGVATSENTSVILRSNSIYATIIDSTENYGNIPVGQVITVPSGFQVQVANNIPDNQPINFKLICSSGSSTWSSLFSINGHAAAMAIGTITIADPTGNTNNKLDPGETVDMGILINNMGSASASNVNAVLSTNDPYIILSTTTNVYGNIAANNAVQKIFTISALATTPAGHQASFNINLTGDHGLTYSSQFTVIIGRIPVLIVDLDGNTNSGTFMKTALLNLNVAHDYITTFPTSPNSYGALFVCLGTYPNKHVLTSSEGQTLKTYLLQGGNIYMEGGDTWYFDQQANPTPLHPMFKITGLKDNGGTLTTINGVNNTFTANMSFVFNGDNNYIDKIEAIAPAYKVFTNNSPAYDVAVANDPGLGYKTVGSAYEFGGLTDASAPSTKKLLMQEYLNFFNLGESGFWVNFVGVPTDVAITDTVFFTDLSSTKFSSCTWDFTGGTPSTSTLENPAIVYNTIGTYDVSLQVTGSDSIMTTTKFGYVNVSDYTKINENAPSLEVSIFPNPSDGNVTIRYRTEGVKAQRLSVYNLTGNLINSENLQNAQQDFIRLSNLPSGIYLIKIETNKGTVTRKLIVK